MAVNSSWINNTFFGIALLLCRYVYLPSRLSVCVWVFVVVVILSFFVLFHFFYSSSPYIDRMKRCVCVFFLNWFVCSILRLLFNPFVWVKCAYVCISLCWLNALIRKNVSIERLVNDFEMYINGHFALTWSVYILRSDMLICDWGLNKHENTTERKKTDNNNWANKWTKCWSHKGKIIICSVVNKPLNAYFINRPWLKTGSQRNIRMQSTRAPKKMMNALHIFSFLFCVRISKNYINNSKIDLAESLLNRRMIR